MAAYTESKLIELGYDEVIVDDYGSVFGVMHGTGGGSSVLLNCHMDVVDEGEAPDYTYRNRKRFAGGTLEVRCRVSEGVLREIRFFGDFLSRKEVGELEERLAGQPFVRASIRAVFAECDWENYLGAITREEAEGLLFDEVVW